MRRSRLGFSLGCTLAAAAALPVTAARSAEVLASSDMPSEKATLRESGAERIPDFCAAYGEGFVRLQGTDTCVKIVGHLRLDTTISPGTQLEWGTDDFGPAPDNAEPIRSHVRLNGNLGPAGFR